ncbi:aromatic aminotransferase Aro8 [Leucosporidium creatinivorum]|uniref:Aromatic aminotransferase Aro8 n=1 Tax=Leucosporidium creatinivorum TaxID=106004 RepID=A0A1Y2EGT2_9BASI|nr:aromatic aminotransferase Aro8 [Leucosporidium creatinivorum]
MTVPAPSTVAVESIDLSHHINSTSKARQPSPLKDLLKYMVEPGMCSLAGGLPHPTLFPFQEATINAYPATADLAIDAPTPAASDLLPLSILKYGAKGDDLATTLQYGLSNGHPSLVKFAREFTNELFTPARQDYEILLNNGNTDGWNKIVGLLCEPGDYLLTEEYTFTSAQGVWIPQGIKAAPVKMDEHGMRSDHLRQTLAEWETKMPGVKRPHVMYIVPVGSNPTGSTMPAKRRQEIYNICVEFDVVIVEDDPYTFLQFPRYDLNAPSALVAQTAEQFKTSLVPSFLKYDTQGRVIRMDTFSKTIAPGSRVGYFIANPLFTERLLRGTEVETQAPSGWSQIILSKLLWNWGIEGFLTWLSNLRDQYQHRRDQMIDAFARLYDLRPASSTSVPGAEGLVAFAKGTETPIFSFVPPTGGMFIWARFYLNNSPRYAIYANEEDPEQAFMTDLWKELAAASVLLVPGAYYSPWQGKDKVTTATRGEEANIGYFRLTYAMNTVRHENEQGLERMSKVLQKVWGL